MTRREPVERIIVLCIRIYIHIYKPRPGSQAQANAQLHVTYDSLTGIIFELSLLLFGWSLKNVPTCTLVLCVKAAASAAFCSFSH